jgi:hypothetical protein
MASRPARVLLCVAVIGGAAVLTGCRDSTDLSLCPAWGFYTHTAEQISKDRPTGGTAADWLVAVHEVLGDLDQLREVSDSRHTDAISTAETALEELQGTLESVEPDQEYSTWAPLVSDDIDAVLDADQRLRELIEPECATTPTPEDS